MTKPVYTLRQVKTYLQGKKELKFAGLDEISLSDLLENILTYNKDYDTIYAGSRRLQTEKGHRRSIGDLFRIIYFYHPKITLTTLYKSLFKSIVAGRVLSSICMDTGMRVYRATKGNEKGFLNGSPTDEFGTELADFEHFEECQSKESKWGYEYTEEHLKFIQI